MKTTATNWIKINRDNIADYKGYFVNIEIGGMPTMIYYFDPHHLNIVDLFKSVSVADNVSRMTKIMCNGDKPTIRFVVVDCHMNEIGEMHGGTHSICIR